MKKTIWFMWKDGEERTFAMTSPPSFEWAARQQAAGFLRADGTFVINPATSVACGVHSCAGLATFCRRAPCYKAHPFTD